MAIFIKVPQIYSNTNIGLNPKNLKYRNWKIKMPNSDQS